MSRILELPSLDGKHQYRIKVGTLLGHLHLKLERKGLLLWSEVDGIAPYDSVNPTTVEELVEYGKSRLIEREKERLRYQNELNDFFNEERP